MALLELLRSYKGEHMDNNDNFATELIKEQKSNAKRWFIIAMVELGIILAIVIGHWAYDSLPIETGTETTSITQDSDDNGTNNYVGGDYNGKADDKDSKNVQP